MGKIFKALEKAEKLNVAKPSRRAVADKTRSDPSIAEHATDERSAVYSNLKYPAHARLHQDIVPPEIPSTPQPPARLDERAPITPSTQIEKPVEPSVDRHPSHGLDMRSSNGNGKLETGPRERAAESKVVQRQDTGQEPEGIGIALVKPEVHEPPHALPQSNRQSQERVRQAKQVGQDEKKSRNSVRVQYSRTKVQINDPKNLRNNQVFAVFEDIETTNQFKILRTQVLKKLKDLGGNSILVTSANPYEGKTFTSINLGVSIAKEFDRTVLIIDADIRKPTRQHTDFSTEFFSLKVEKGLTDYLAGDADIEDILINPGIDKLTLIPGGMPVDNSPELLNSAKMEEMMMEIKSRYPSDRLVIVDGPAILHFPDAMILYRYVDGVLPVVEVEKTASEDLKKMMNHLQEANILGVVLNKNRG